MANSLSSFALMTLLAAGGVAAAPHVSAQEPGGASLEMQEKARRTMAIRDALQQVQEARLAYASKRYTEAVEHYRNALSVLPKAPATQAQEKFIRESLSDALIARAIDYRSVGRREEAIEFLREAVEQDPKNRRAKVELTYTEDPTRTNPALTPELVGDVEEVNRLLNLAYGYLELGKYDEAISSFESVLKIDSYNSAARRGIEAVQHRRTAYFKSAHDAKRSAMLNEVSQTWDQIYSVETAPPPQLAADTSSGVTTDALTEESAHADTVGRMLIPNVVLEDVGLEEALDIIRGIIRNQEAAGIKSQRPINVTTDFGPQGSQLREQLAAKRISLHMSDVTLKEILDEVANHFGLEYYMVPTGVEFSIGEQSERIVTRVFNGVGAYVFDQEASDSSDEEEDDEASGNRVRVSRMRPREFFKSHGITFPKGARESYNPSTRRLEISNTRHNIEKIASILNTTAVKEWNVVLNIIVIETDEKNLEDLGFDWMFNVGLGTREAVLAGGTDQAVAGFTGMPIVGTTGRYLPDRPSGVVTQNLRSIQQLSGAKDMDRLIELGSVKSFNGYNPEDSTSPTIFGLRGVWSAADVTVLMHGLSQKSNSDTLYNPRLVLDPSTAEGVSFTNVREMYLPMSYEAPEIYQKVSTAMEGPPTGFKDLDGDGVITLGKRVYMGAVSIAVGAQPTDFQRVGADEEAMDGIGSIVRVHKAEPSPDGSSVRLAITTVVNDFEGFIDWGSPIYSVMWSFKEVKDIYLSPNHIFMPIFKRYTTNTNISVANGAVLVMGGLREARTVRFEDKVPLLGDLPLVGRLFRSEGEKSQRRALLVFAKVNIVDPTGHDVSSGEADTAAQSPM